jgi:hypothetical protein
VSASGIVRTVLAKNPFSEKVFVFRGKLGDLVQDALVGRRWAVLVGKKIVTREIHQAASGERYRFCDTSAVVDVSGRDWLGTAGVHFRAADGDISSTSL